MKTTFALAAAFVVAAAAAAETVTTTEKTVTSSQPGTVVSSTEPAVAVSATTSNAGTAATYIERAEAAYRAAGIPDDIIIRLRDYDVKIRDARVANDAALVKQYYTDQVRLLSSQHINGIRTYLKANPVPATAATAVTIWEDPAYVSVASPTTVISPGTVVTNEVRTAPVAVRQVQVPVVQGSVPVVVKDPVPVVRSEVSVPATVKVETAPAASTTIRTTEETVTTVKKTDGDKDKD